MKNNRFLQISKTILFGFVISVIMLCFYITPTMAQTYTTATCELVNYDDNCTSWTTATRTVEIPGFEPCKVKIEYKTRMCFDLWTQIEIERFWFDINDSLCATFRDSLFPLGIGTSPNEIFARKVVENLYPVLLKASFLDFYNSLSPWAKPFAECPNRYGEFHIIEGSCLAFEIRFFQSGDLPGGNWNLSLQYHRCSETCCFYIGSLCFDTATQEVEYLGDIGHLFHGDRIVPQFLNLCPNYLRVNPRYF